MERRWIEIGSIRPDESTRLGIEPHRVERGMVPQRAKQVAAKNALEIDALFRAVGKRHHQRIGPCEDESGDSVDGMLHVLPEWIDLDRRPTRLQELPILLQLRAMNLRPCRDEPLLRCGQSAAQTLNCVDRIHRGLILVIRVEVRTMMRLTCLDEHPNDDAKKACALCLLPCACYD